MDIWRKPSEDILRGIPHVTLELIIPDDDEEMPLLKVKLDERGLGQNAFEILRQMKTGDPEVYVNETLLAEDALLIHPVNLNKEWAIIAAQCLREVLSSRS